jgi:hypothetical protein
VEALQELVARDNGPGGPVKDFHYVEFDVHVGGLPQAAAAAAALMMCL